MVPLIIFRFSDSALFTEASTLLTPVGSTAIGFSMKICFRADRKSTRLNSSHVRISYAVFCLKKKMKAGLCQRLADCHRFLAPRADVDVLERMHDRLARHYAPCALHLGVSASLHHVPGPPRLL